LLIVKIRFLLTKIVPIRILIILRRSFSVAGLVSITLISVFKEDYCCMVKTYSVKRLIDSTKLLYSFGIHVDV
jgi:hypothetical protein